MFQKLKINYGRWSIYDDNFTEDLYPTHIGLTNAVINCYLSKKLPVVKNIILFHIWNYAGRNQPFDAATISNENIRNQVAPCMQRVLKNKYLFDRYHRIFVKNI